MFYQNNKQIFTCSKRRLWIQAFNACRFIGSCRTENQSETFIDPLWPMRWQKPDINSSLPPPPEVYPVHCSQLMPSDWPSAHNWASHWLPPNTLWYPAGRNTPNKAVTRPYRDFSDLSWIVLFSLLNKSCPIHCFIMETFIRVTSISPLFFSWNVCRM